MTVASGAPAISVVLPTYNRAASLDRAIGSVLAQTFADFELLVVDDASTDGTAQMLATIADPRLQVLRLPRNRGAAGARNAGIAAARGEWIAFQDSDDEWLPTKLEQQYTVAEQAPAQVGLVLGGYVAVMGTEHVPIRARSLLTGGPAMPDLLDGWPIITPTWLVRKDLLDALGGFDESYPCLEDWDLVFRLSDRCEIRAVAGPTLLKHGSLDSVCADPRRMHDALQKILRTHLHRWAGETPRLARRLSHVAWLQFRLGDRPASRRTFARALRTDPWTPATHALYWSSLLGGRAMQLSRRLWPRHAGMAP